MSFASDFSKKAMPVKSKSFKSQPGAGPVWAQLLLHGLLIIGVAAVVEPPLVLVMVTLSSTLIAWESVTFA